MKNQLVKIMTLALVIVGTATSLAPVRMTDDKGCEGKRRDVLDEVKKTCASVTACSNQHKNVRNLDCRNVAILYEMLPSHSYVVRQPYSSDCLLPEAGFKNIKCRVLKLERPSPSALPFTPVGAGAALE